MTAEKTAVANGQIPNDAQRFVNGLIVGLTVRARLRDLSQIHTRVVAVGCVEVSRCIVDCLRPREGVQQIEATREAMLEFCLKAVVAEEACRYLLIDRGERSDRASGLDAQCARRRIGCGLVEVCQHPDVDRMLSNIGEREDAVAGDFALHVKVPGLHVARRDVLGDISSLRDQSVEIARRYKVRRIALSDRAEAAGVVVVSAQRLYRTREGEGRNLVDRRERLMMYGPL